ncbi:MAG TPA: ATPase, T2SS/T4P/T4SS family [Anaerolineaceae bacterium]|nr:ATPase, T2SS/T4P/T4SS family [Anaerolineaceae bacterium]
MGLSDLEMIGRVRDVLVSRSIKPPDWRDVDPEKRTRFYDEVRGVLIEQGGDRSSINRRAQIITDALSGVGLLDHLLRDPSVEEIFVRRGEVAVEYDGAFHYLGKLAEDRYFEDLAIHVADQGGATLRGDRPAVLIDLPNGERFTAIIPRLSSEGTAINIRTFGRQVKTLEEIEQAGTFQKPKLALSGCLEDIHDPQVRSKVARLQHGPDRFLAWVMATLSGSILVAGEMGSGKTTLLNALSAFLPATAPVSALETFRELDLQHPFLLRAVAPAELPEGTPGVTLDWVLNVIYTRMNPAAVMVGEVVGPEALQFLKATCLGRNAMTTIHGGTVEEALMRLEQLALAAAPELGLSAVRSMVSMGVDVIALMGRVNRSGRVERSLQAIAVMDGLNENGSYRLQYLYRGQGEQTHRTLEKAFRNLTETA